MRVFLFGLVVVLLAGCGASRIGDLPPATDAASGLPLTREDARHLLSRTGFGVTRTGVAALEGQPRRVAVERLLHDVRREAVTPPPPGIDRYEPPHEAKGADREDRRALLQEQGRLSLDLRAWWLREMRESPSPLTERLTLFWHNHFVSSQEKVRSPTLMYRQNVLLRRHAAGSFAKLLHAVARDPAMVVYLDNARNRKGAPNENFARELMELFTLGEGHYAEADVKEAARAFTGWGVDRRTGAFEFRPGQHDDGIKTVLGRSGRLDGDDVVDRLLAHPATAEFVVRKLWREFVSPDSQAAEVSRIAAAFRTSGYEIRVALRALLLSDAFWAPANRGVLVRSPVELVVGTLGTFEATVPDYAPFALLVARLGQNLFAPPSVKGWPGGETWIDATTLLQRKQFLLALFRGQDLGAATFVRGGGGERSERLLRKGGPAMRERLVQGLAGLGFDPDAWVAGARDDGEVFALLLPLPPVTTDVALRPTVAEARDALQDPVYQLR
jgi:uncharacterized protein (DUF1800 family)